MVDRRRNSAEREYPSSRRRSSWAPDQVNQYFSGLTDAASHLAERVSNNYLNSNLPLSPIPRTGSRQKLHTRSDKGNREKLLSTTDTFFLDTATMLSEETRCKKCYRFITGAPDPNLDHEVSSGDARCTLDHHPEPCDYKSKTHGDCRHYPLSLESLANRNDIMEGSISRVEGSIVSLSTLVENLTKMVGQMTKVTPSPSDSLTSTAPTTASNMTAPGQGGPQLGAHCMAPHHNLQVAPSFEHIAWHSHHNTQPEPVLVQILLL